MPPAPLLIGLGIAGLGLQTYGTIQAGRAQTAAGEASKRIGEAQAGLAEMNAQIADLQAEDARSRGHLDAQRYRQQVRTLLGEQRAAIGASGIDVGTGTAVDVQVDTEMLGELDARTILLNADREAWGYDVEATDLRARAEILRQEGANAAEIGRANARASYISGAGTLLSGGANLLNAHYGFAEGGGVNADG